jgi:DNA polymerase-3 subunit delta
MQLVVAQLTQQLQRGLRSLYTLHSDEPLLQQEAADLIRATAKGQGFTERTVHSVSGARFDWAEILASCQSMSLFAHRQLVEVRIPGGKPGKEGAAALQQLAQLTQNNDSTVVLVLLPQLDKAAKTSAWFTALDGCGVTVAIDALPRTALPQWIAQRLQLQGQQVDGGEQGIRTLQFFADRVEGNLLAAHQEIQKLDLLYPKGTLSFEQVEGAVLDVARYDVFKLSEALLAGQSLRGQRMIQGLQAEGESVVLVHYVISEDIRTLKRIKDALSAGRPLPLAMREQRVWGVKEKLMERILPRLGQTHLNHLLRSAHVVDGIVKGLKDPDWPHDPWQALLHLAQSLSTTCAIK